ncbi:MAG: DUF547 domain-containing protein [Pseudomonadota bacterium]
MFSRALSLIALLLLSPALLARPFDHEHAAWSELLDKHVRWIDGVASQVDYAGMAADQAALDAYLEALSAVTPRTYRNWTRDQQLAFLINAYNAFTVDLVLTQYPDLNSIKQIGGFFKSPWKIEIGKLLGQPRTLDEIEHEMIREEGVFDEPRIHAAVVCASIGCPALRTDAFTAERLDIQLEDSIVRFLSDRSRNRLRGEDLQVSKIFDWYGDDWDDLTAFFARHAVILADDAAGQRLIRNGAYDLDFLSYDWDLNDVSG